MNFSVSWWWFNDNDDNSSVELTIVVLLCCGYPHMPISMLGICRLLFVSLCSCNIETAMTKSTPHPRRPLLWYLPPVRLSRHTHTTCSYVSIPPPLACGDAPVPITGWHSYIRLFFNRCLLVFTLLLITSSHFILSCAWRFLTLICLYYSLLDLSTALSSILLNIMFNKLLVFCFTCSSEELAFAFNSDNNERQIVT